MLLPSSLSSSFCRGIDSVSLRAVNTLDYQIHTSESCQSNTAPWVMNAVLRGNVAPDLMEGFGLMKSFREIIQNQLLFEGFGIMKSFWDRNKKMADSEC